jgi:hypothetical protein
MSIAVKNPRRNPRAPTPYGKKWSKRKDLSFRSRFNKRKLGNAWILSSGCGKHTRRLDKSMFTGSGIETLVVLKQYNSFESLKRYLRSRSINTVLYGKGIKTPPNRTLYAVAIYRERFETEKELFDWREKYGEKIDGDNYANYLIIDRKILARSRVLFKVFEPPVVEIMF